MDKKRIKLMSGKIREKEIRLFLRDELRLYEIDMKNYNYKN